MRALLQFFLLLFRPSNNLWVYLWINWHGNNYCNECHPYFEKKSYPAGRVRFFFLIFKRRKINILSSGVFEKASLVFRSLIGKKIDMIVMSFSVAPVSRPRGYQTFWWGRFVIGSFKKGVMKGLFDKWKKNLQGINM